LKEILASDKVGVVHGARQVGKTTLVEHVLAGRGAVFLNFDVEVDKARFRAAATLAPGEALRSLGDPAVLVIDEAQRLPESSRIIKGKLGHRGSGQAQRHAGFSGGTFFLAHAGAVGGGRGHQTGRRSAGV
jgi:AAA+ ATPase superfamily predicted ATPase